MLIKISYTSQMEPHRRCQKQKYKPYDKWYHHEHLKFPKLMKVSRIPQNKPFGKEPLRAGGLRGLVDSSILVV